MTIECRLFDFNIEDKIIEDEEESGSSDEEQTYSDNKQFLIQMFGIDEEGKKYSIFVQQFKPFFYMEVGEKWSSSDKDKMLNYIKNNLKQYYHKSVCWDQCKLIQKKKLYMFDGGKYYKFLYLEFENTRIMNQVKYLFMEGDKMKKIPGFKEQLQIYESNIPPLLRYFHIQNISPSGWVKIEKYDECRNKTTYCDYEVLAYHSNILPMNDKESAVPYKICSFDIEASSSHGDFPLPVKTYKKLAKEIIDHFDNYDVEPEEIKERLLLLVSIAFGYNDVMKQEPYEYDEETLNDMKNEINIVYPKKKFDNFEKLKVRFDDWYKYNNSKKRGGKKVYDELQSVLSFLQKNKNIEDEEDEIGGELRKFKKHTGFDDLLNGNFTRDEKILQLDKMLSDDFPELEGDKVTFIGSTFLKYGQKEPYLNHCIVLNSCSKIKEVPNSEIETYDTEEEVLCGWQKVIQREDPDIIIGYNIFGFDYEFMFQRARQLDCIDTFLKLSRNIDENCYKRNREGQINIEENKIVIASGEHELKFIKMSGRLQIDMYNYFRRDFNLTSYKLDSVASEFISDGVNKLEHIDGKTKIYTKNMTGLYVGSFVHFEEVSHSTEYYKDGAKFKIVEIDKNEKTFCISGKEELNMKLKVKWGMAKDDVTPKDIFELTKKGPKERAIVAKYCIQDCNLVHHLLNKIDVVTGFIEMAKICSVPINFLVMRGQGIKLTSFIAKKCREKETLMPVLERKLNDDGYEGAIVLDPKCNLYLDNPVACVDYASLYPSSMISENLSHDSKVWTKTYDLKGNCIEKTGYTNENGEYIYDNLPDYEYVDVTYDTYKYIREGENKAAKKVISGHKVCRWAANKNGSKAIMPSILEELLASRKATRKLIPQQKDEFMKNILDKRQLSYKLTANSLYGQCGAKTSTFYEKDVAASTTATGRKLLTYARRIIEEVYGNKICKTKNHGEVLSNAEYIYGDTDSVFFTFNLKDPVTGEDIRGKKALEITIELAKEAGELASKFLKRPHDLEYEKTFMPFCLLSKKRYVGMLYEEDPNKCKQKSMGIVLKRRDNAPIVKDVYGGIIDILMDEQDIQKAIEFLKQCLQNLLDEKIPIDKLIITKSLRSNYKNPNQIAHKVLADRIAKRDPGNKPASGDRIPFVYIVNSNKRALQGEKIETPSYILDNKVKIDYSHYITNQIMKPVQQLFSLVLEDIPEFKKKIFKVKNLKTTLQKYKKELEPEKYEKKKEEVRCKEIKFLLFDKYLNEISTKRNNNTSITSFFKK